MKISSFQFSGRDLVNTTQIAADALKDRNTKRDPSFMFVFYSSADHLVESRDTIIENFPNTKIVATTSEQGIVSNNANFYNLKHAIGVEAFFDEDGAYGVASSQINTNNNIRDQINTLVDQALSDCDRKGELPKLIWFHSPNALQGDVIDALEKIFGTSVPIFGGVPGVVDDLKACYDHNNIFINDQYLILALFYPSCEVKTKFSSLFKPTKYSGMITSVDQNHLIEIDYKSAYSVYGEWLNNLVPKEMYEEEQQENYLKELLTYYPLGVQIGISNNEQKYKIIRITDYSDEQDLISFNNFKFGDHVTLMALDPKSSFEQEFKSQLFDNSRITKTRIHGIVSVICAGYRPYFDDEHLKFLNKVSFPMMGFISSGEQGRFDNGASCESNFMLETVVFYERN